MNATLDVVYLLNNLTTGEITDVDGLAVSPTKSNSTGLQIMSEPTVQVQFKKTVAGVVSNYALPAAVTYWTATLDSDFNHTTEPVAFADVFNAAGSWVGGVDPVVANGQLTFVLNMRTEGALAKLGTREKIAGYIEINGWESDATDAALLFSTRIAIRVANLINPSNSAAVPYDVDANVTAEISDAIGAHDVLNTAHGMTSMSAAKAHVESAHGVTASGDFVAGTNASAVQGGIAIGAGAEAAATGAIQIGAGINSTAGAIQITDKVLMNSDGHIPLARLDEIRPIPAALYPDVATDPTVYTARFLGDMLCGQSAANKKMLWIAFAEGTAGWLPIYTEP